MNKIDQYTTTTLSYKHDVVGHIYGNDKFNVYFIDQVNKGKRKTLYLPFYFQGFPIVILNYHSLWIKNYV